MIAQPQLTFTVQDGRPLHDGWLARLTLRRDGAIYGMETTVGKTYPADHGATAFSVLLKSVGEAQKKVTA